MNRRTLLKSLTIFASVGIASFTVVKWLEFSKGFNIKELEGKRQLLAELVDTIIPTTDTPGAKEAGVHDYIIRVIKDCSSLAEQRHFLKGIVKLEQYTRDRYFKEFADCTSNEKSEIVQYVSERDQYSSTVLKKIVGRLFGASFYSKLHSLTVEGFCTSYIGATQGLAYDYIPARYIACLPLEKAQKSWATK